MVLILEVKLEEEIKSSYATFLALFYFSTSGRLCADEENMFHSILFYNYLHFKIVHYVKYTAAVADKTKYKYVGLNLAFLHVVVTAMLNGLPHKQI